MRKLKFQAVSVAALWLLITVDLPTGSLTGFSVWRPHWRYITALGARERCRMASPRWRVTQAMGSRSLARQAAFYESYEYQQVSTWEPTATGLIVGMGVLAYTWKTNQAMQAREERVNKEAELRSYVAKELAGPSAEGERALDALRDEVLQLREQEAAAKEIFGFGEATPTSLRTSWEVRLAPDERDVFDPLPESMLRKTRSGQQTKGSDPGEAEPYKPPSWVDDRLQLSLLAVGLPLLVVLLAKISFP